MSISTTIEAADVERLEELGQQLRVDAVRIAGAAGSGHPTSSMSAADLVAVLAERHLRADLEHPDDPARDHLVFSKGHASPLLYALYRAAGVIDEGELFTYRTLGSRLEGHPTPRFPWVDVATGSLGQGLSIGAGMAAVLDRLERGANRVWVLCGDSELAEGSVWEAVEYAGHERLAGLTLVIDVNRLGQRGPTRHGWDTGAYAARLQAFGWHPIQVDGHDVTEIDAAYAAARRATDHPTAIVARTVKGRGVSSVADAEGAHGKPVTPVDDAVKELGGTRGLRLEISPPEPRTQSQPGPLHRQADREPARMPEYAVGGDSVATRDAFGAGLAALGDVRPDVIGLDGEVADSTRMQAFANAHPERFFECYIAEQLMVGAAVGMQARGWTPYVATFAAFLTRAYDFVRMAAVSRADLRLIGSHAGTEIGADGPSQMGLEDIAMFRAVHGSTVLSPCDANQAVQLTMQLADRGGINYLRTGRGAWPVLYPPSERFQIGGCRTLRSSEADVVTIAASGVTVHEALAAADELTKEGIAARVIDVYSIKPIDATTLREAAAATGRVITVEDHWHHGGLGDAVLDALIDGTRLPHVTKLTVGSMPGSATPAEQLAAAGIDRAHIVAAARDAAERPHAERVAQDQT